MHKNCPMSSSRDRSAGVTITRRILVNNPCQQQKFCSNKISTSKYSCLSFLPRFLFEQFRRYSNVFFLVITIFQQISDVSPTGRYATLIPFMFILLISAVKEIFDDLKRRRTDRKVNNYEVQVFREGIWNTALWRDIKVGEIVKIYDGQPFPADLVLLSSSEPYGVAYIETSSLDGESNLKTRQAHLSTCHLITERAMSNFLVQIDCELPNKHLNEFHGKLTIFNKKVHSLNVNQLLLRGAKLKNTKWIFGAVVYTGHDAKLLKNAHIAPLKRSSIDTMMNNRLVILFVALIILTLVSAAGARIFNDLVFTDSWYLNIPDKGNFALNVLTFFILYSNLIPISLQVTIEMVRFFQAIYINNDLEMYDEATDTAASARSSNLNEELGRVKFVMSDKTGTLTRNVMKFKRCTIAGVDYGNDTSDEFSDPTLIQNLNNGNNTQIYDFLLAMSVCHTVVSEKHEEDGSISYQASSPDENALVKGAASQGFIFSERTPNSMSIYAAGKKIDFKLLNVLDFNSDRKRMSVILRFPDNSIRLFCKGADNVIIDRLAKNSDQEAIQTCQEHLKAFAENGYRTLCFSMRTIPEDVYQKWNAIHHEAAIALSDREKLLGNAAEEIEKELTLIGATAIEDKLQDLVPETIKSLLAADIRVWVLTGDKRETAVNIAQSSGLCTKSTHLFVLDTPGFDFVLAKLKDFNQKALTYQASNVEFALVVSGEALREVVVGEARQLFATLAWLCRSVVCCRMTPMQKAEVVDLVRSFGEHIVLAIGDGANDVAMLQAANVGVGLTGEEGMQAASASDYSIGQFHFLQRLIFVHGTWNFERTVKVILFSFYKNIILCIIELWFAFFSAFSGQTIFDRWTMAMFNVIFTAWLPLAIGLFDRPISENKIMEHPELYPALQKKASSDKRFIMYILTALWHSFLLYFLSHAFIGSNIISADGREGGWLVLGNSIYTYLVVTVSLKALMETHVWTIASIIASVGSILLWFVFVMIYSFIWPILPIGSDFVGMGPITMSNPVFWLGLLLVPITTLLTDFVIRIVLAHIAKSERKKNMVDLPH